MGLLLYVAPDPDHSSFGALVGLCTVGLYYPELLSTNRNNYNRMRSKAYFFRIETHALGNALNPREHLTLGFSGGNICHFLHMCICIRIRR